MVDEAVGAVLLCGSLACAGAAAFAPPPVAARCWRPRWPSRRRTRSALRTGCRSSPAGSASPARWRWSSAGSAGRCALSWLDFLMGGCAVGALAVTTGAELPAALAAAGVAAALGAARWRVSARARVRARRPDRARRAARAGGAAVRRRRLADRAGAAPDQEFNPVVLAAILAYMTTALTLLVVGQFVSLPPVAATLATVTVLVGMARAGITIVDRLRVSDRQAVTDDLTGLGNRRHLLARLERRDLRHRPRGRAAADRPRRLQGAQRHARSPRRRPGPAPDRPAAAGGAAAGRHAGAARRRRVRGRARPGRRGVGQRRRPAAARGARAHVRRRRDPRAHRRQHRHRAVPGARARRARPAPARRRRDVRGQAHPHRPRGLPARARPPQPAPARAARRAARRARRRPADPPLPAEGRDRDRRRCAASRRSCAGRIRAAGC